MREPTEYQSAENTAALLLCEISASPVIASPGKRGIRGQAGLSARHRCSVPSQFHSRGYVSARRRPGSAFAGAALFAFFFSAKGAGLDLTLTGPRSELPLTVIPTEAAFRPTRDLLLTGSRARSSRAAPAISSVAMGRIATNVSQLGHINSCCAAANFPRSIFFENSGGCDICERELACGAGSSIG